VHSAPDTLGREKDLVLVDVGIGAYAVAGPFPIEGWAISGQLHIDAAVADVFFCVLRLPASWAGR
jgi:hypothetical protein